MTIPLQVLVCMCRFPVHSDRWCAISLRFDNGVQEGDGAILLVVLHCKIYSRVNTVDVLRKPCLLTSLWMTKVSSTNLHQNLGGLEQCLELFVLSTPYRGWPQWDCLGNPWLHPQPVHRTGLVLCNVKLIALHFLVKRKNDTIER